MNVKATQEYIVSSKIKHNDNLFSSFEVKLSEGNWKTAQNSDCNYAAIVTKLLKNIIS